MAKQEEKKRKQRKKRRWLALLCGALIFLVSALGLLELGCVYTKRNGGYWYPDYAKEDITPLLDKESLTPSDYEQLYRQTGLTKLAIDDMRGSYLGRTRILTIQDIFFKKFTVKSSLFSVFTYMDEIDGLSSICSLKDGDIIVTSATRVSWWQYGHAAIVVDGDSRMIAESIAPGYESEITNASAFTVYANFMVLRPKAEEDVKTEICKYVKEEMLGIPYRMTVGIFSKKYPEKLQYSQCAHLVWYAYKKFGIDLDGNGGGMVKPQDIARSKNVELVQAFGFNLDTLWS